MRYLFEIGRRTHLENIIALRFGQEMKVQSMVNPTIQAVKMAESDIPAALEVFERAYAKMAVPSNEREWFEGDLRRAFQQNVPNNITFFKIEEDQRLVSFAGIQTLTFTRYAWALRWGTTDPDYQRQGLMGQLIDLRLKYAEENSPTIGSAHLMSRNPGIYLKRGFKTIYERGPENSASYLMKVINDGLAGKSIER